jgi:hypothetical protein
MKKTLLTIFVALTCLLSTTAFIVKNSGGKAGQTGSPSEGDCGACHSGGSSIVSGATITAIPSFSNNTYVPGNTYTMTVAVGALSFTNFGFACEILNSANTDAGTMQNAGPGVQFLNAANGRKNATHTAPKSGSSFATFSFQWVAPSTGAVTIYAAGNCVNGNSTTTGDLPVKTSLALVSPTVATGIADNSADMTGFSFYPNPVKESVHINYFLNHSGQVLIELVGINGQLVSQLVNEKQSEGLQKMSVRISSDVTSGVYFLRTSVNNKTVNQKLITIN